MNTGRVREWRTTDGRVHASLHRTDEWYVVHFKRMARFEVSRNLAMVRCTPCRSGSTGLMRHLFLDQVMPLVLSLAGEHVLHASAVDYHGRAVAFVGESGVGKSTTAATLGQGAGRILADDCVVFSERAAQFLVNAPYTSLRLWEDSATALNLGRGRLGHRTGKRRFQQNRRLSFAVGPSPLGAVCLLARSNAVDRPTLERVRAAEAVVMLVRSAFKFDISERSLLAREFRLFSRLVGAVPCFRLTTTDSLDQLPSLRELVIGALQGRPENGRGRRIA
jgi:hypothetical protein